MYLIWPWIGLVAAASVITAVLMIKLAHRCGVRLTTLPERPVSSYLQDHGDQDIQNYIIGLDGRDSTIDYNMQTLQPPTVGVFPPSESGYDPNWEQGCTPSEAAYPSSQADYGPNSSRHEYAL